MKEYETLIVEKLVSTVTVEAENREEAHKKALDMLAEDFNAPYHDYCDEMGWEILSVIDIDAEED